MSGERRESDFRKAVNEIRRIHEQERQSGFGNLDCWDIYGETFSQYVEDFNVVLGGTDLWAHLRRRESITVVDLMSPSRALLTLFRTLNPNQQKLGIAVSLEDLRSENERTLDRQLGITQIAGDLIDRSTVDQIHEVLNGRSADLITIRAKGGFRGIPKHAKFYALAAKRVWDMLSDQGGMFVGEVPDPVFCRENNIPIENWVTILRQNDIFARYAPQGNRLSSRDFSYVLVIKNPDSPKHLPFLPLV